jgi:hypothetical protein
VVLVVPTNTVAPTKTARPPASATATHTAVPPTATHTPSPIPPTETSVPSATANPVPGDVVYAPTAADDWNDWIVIYFGTDDYNLAGDKSDLTFEIEGEETYVYAGLDEEFDYADVQIDADVVIVNGPNENNLSLMCRFTERGWYEFNILSGGLWSIYKYDDVNSYTELKSGGSTAIKPGQSRNHLTAVCDGDTLTFYVNDVELGSAHDETFSEGTFGMSASTFDIGELEVRFSDFTVRLADPNADLGNNVAPTVAPSSGDGGLFDNDFFTVPVPGDTLAGTDLQYTVLFSLYGLVQLSAPDGCESQQVTNTTVTEIVEPLVFDTPGFLTEGSWKEAWTVDMCGTMGTFRVEFTANNVGSANFLLQKIS